VRRIIIDTDPGIDDAIAILLALAETEELEVLGIVAVAGNLPLAQTERNARRVCELAGRPEIPVYAGLMLAAAITSPVAISTRMRSSCSKSFL
jgi:purine nucleosidase